METAQSVCQVRVTFSMLMLRVWTQVMWGVLGPSSRPPGPHPSHPASLGPSPHWEAAPLGTVALLKAQALSGGLHEACQTLPRQGLTLESDSWKEMIVNRPNWVLNTD